jgi:hypothetical protein
MENHNDGDIVQVGHVEIAIDLGKKVNANGPGVLPRRAAGVNPVSLPPDFRQLSADNCYARAAVRAASLAKMLVEEARDLLERVLALRHACVAIPGAVRLALEHFQHRLDARLA